MASQVANLFSFFASIKFGFFQDQDQIIWLFFYSFFKVFEFSGINIDSLGPILIFLAHNDVSSVSQLYELQTFSDNRICTNLFDIYINIDPIYRQEFFEKLFSFVEW